LSSGDRRRTGDLAQRQYHRRPALPWRGSRSGVRAQHAHEPSGDPRRCTTRGPLHVGVERLDGCSARRGSCLRLGRGCSACVAACGCPRGVPLVCALGAARGRGHVGNGLGLAGLLGSALAGPAELASCKCARRSALLQPMSDPSHIFAVILAGGSGTRFWPASRRLRPKQLLALASGDERSLLAATVERVLPMVPATNILVATGLHLLSATREALPQLPEDSFLAEPQAKNTAPCIAWAAQVAYSR